ncbi:RNA polymerase sigma factor [Tengunoibacter tsumagoiensis]|uniref:RNA polymerase sigma factor RpoE n=1 Tax=Tengunoibacter tsumagoiensis TaxID=2014871 RepID=A0A402A3L6_9CHLR|nr:sigma-70 family RNA polymerase sigma factor [Tengunoibacter tsumagoiensis]GCE13734.1 RNA polymerase sigma factor RpoE [Tengunoibacter tsumagoiensis]
MKMQNTLSPSVASSAKYSYNDLPERALIELVLAGDQRGFEGLVQRYHAPLYNFIGRCLHDYELACDVLQFVFLQLYISLPKLSLNLSSQHAKNPLKSWLFQVAWNRCMDELRKRKQRPLLFSEIEPMEDDEEVSILQVLPDPSRLPEEILELQDLQWTLWQAIQDLPPKFRAVVLLRYRSDMSFGEIGRLLHMPENTAKTYFQRARPLLRVALAPYMQASQVSRMYTNASGDLNALEAIGSR